MGVLVAVPKIASRIIVLDGESSTGRCLGDRVGTLVLMAAPDTELYPEGCVQ